MARYMSASLDNTPKKPALPGSYWQAIQRSALCKCPRCGRGRLFGKWLKTAKQCADCGQDWTHERADDFPAYLSILITGHILAPIMISLATDFQLQPMTIVAILIPSAVTMLLAMLQPAKGAVIATQWWHGLNGFEKERLPKPPQDATSPQ